MSIIKSLDEMIRSGQRDGALKVALQIRDSRSYEDLGRPEQRAMAEIFRRLGLADVGVKILYPFVRGRGRSVLPDATAEEELEYGISLIQIGAVAEGMALLSEGQAARLNKSKLFRAFGHFANWEYQEALPLLASYINSELSDPYDYFVGQVNWCAAKVAVGDHEEILQSIDALIQETAANHAHLLSFNLKEIKLQSLVLAERNDDALEFSAAMIKEEESIGGQEQIWFQRWRLLAQCQKTPTPHQISKLEEFSERARGLGLSEIVRDCDFHHARLTHDAERWAKLYFGTRYLAYRNRVEEQSGDLPEEYLWRGTGEATMAALDIQKACVKDARSAQEMNLCRVGGTLHSFLRVLCSDFYRPLTLAELYTYVYPGDYFDPESSPNRIHQLSHRLKQSLNQQEHPILALVSHPMWSAHPADAVAIHYRREGLQKDTSLQAVEWDRWQSFLEQVSWQEGEGLRVSEITKRWRKPIRSVHRFLVWAKERNLLSSRGSGPQTRYVINAPPGKK